MELLEKMSQHQSIFGGSGPPPKKRAKMAKLNLLHEVSNDLKMEYQSGNINEIQINTADGGSIMVKNYKI